MTLYVIYNDFPPERQNKKIHHTTKKPKRRPSVGFPNQFFCAVNINRLALELNQSRNWHHHERYVQSVRLPAPQSPGGDQFPIHYCCFVKQNEAVLSRDNSNTGCARTTVRLSVAFRSAQIIKYYFQQSRGLKFKLYIVFSPVQHTHSYEYTQFTIFIT